MRVACSWNMTERTGAYRSYPCVHARTPIEISSPWKIIGRQQSYGTRVTKWPREKEKPAAQKGCSIGDSLMKGGSSGCEPCRR